MLLFSEIFEQIELAVSKEERISILQKNKSPALVEFFRLLYDTNIVFDVEIPKYRPAIEPAGLNFTYLQNEVKKLYRYVKGDPRSSVLTEKKKQDLLSVTLESLHKDEAELLVGLINKDIGIRHLNQNLVKEAYGL
jgi:hypothetical protein